MTFPGFSSISIYDNMNENCPTIAPDYTRTPDCWSISIFRQSILYDKKIL